MEDKKFVLTEFQDPQPEKRALLDRLFPASMDNTKKAVLKMLLIFVFVFVFTIGADVLSELVFGEDSVGNEFSIGFGFVASLVLSRLAWIKEY